MQKLSGKIQDQGMCNMRYNPTFEYGEGDGDKIRDKCRNFAGTCNSGFDKNLNYCLAKKAKEQGENYCANYFNEEGRKYPPVYIRNIKLQEDEQYEDIVDDDKTNGCANEYRWSELTGYSHSFRRPDKNKYKKIGKKSTPRRSRRKSKRRSTKKSPRKSPPKSKRRSTKKSPRKSPSRSTRKR